MIIPPAPTIPDKPQFKPGEVCELTDTQPYVLKFWEQEFPQLAPEKNRLGQRVYHRQDVELVRRIKYLLNEKEYTIAGVRRVLETGAGMDDVYDEEPEGTLPVPRGAGSAADAGKTSRTDRGDMRSDLSGLLFDGPTESGQGSAGKSSRRSGASAPAGGPGHSGKGLPSIRQAEPPESDEARHELIVVARREAIASAEREAMTLGEMTRLAEERDRLASETVSLRRRLGRARSEIRDIVSALESLRSPRDAN